MNGSSVSWYTRSTTTSSQRSSTRRSQALNYDAIDGDFARRLSSDKATETLKKQVQNALDQGAELVVGDNTHDGNKYTPGVLTGISVAWMHIVRNCSVSSAQLYKVSSDEEAVELASSSPLYGLRDLS